MPQQTGPNFRIEVSFGHGQNGKLVAGVDEVGRGPLAGPVVAAAVVFPAAGPGRALGGRLNDSKKLTAAIRAELVPEIKREAVAWAIAQASVEEIDRINILAASLLAMRRAVLALGMAPDGVLIDGNQMPPELPCPGLTVVGGDGKSYSIAAASILAKEMRDELMRDLAVVHPAYGWARNAGYGTALHRQAIAECGVTEHHRRSFAPVREALEKRRA